MEYTGNGTGPPDILQWREDNLEELYLEDPPPMLQLREEFKVGAAVMYGLIFFLGLIGNFMFTYIVISSASAAIKSVTNYFLVNLSVADFLIALTCAPLQVTILLLGYFPYGEITCYLISFIQPTAVCASSFTLVIVSLDRYMTILHPLRQRLKNPKGVLSLIWIFSAVISVPDVVMINYSLKGGAGRWQCYKEEAPAYDMVILSCVYIVPVLVMLYTYTMMAVTIWKKREIGEVQSSQLITRKNQMLRSKRKMVKMLIFVVSLYTICYFPINILWLVLSRLNLRPEVFAYMFTVFHWFAISHTCWNPIIYFWMNRKIRQRFICIVTSVPCIRRCFVKLEWKIPADRRRSTYTGARLNYMVSLKKEYGPFSKGSGSCSSTEMTVLKTDVSQISRSSQVGRKSLPHLRENTQIIQPDHNSE